MKSGRKRGHSAAAGNRERLQVRSAGGVEQSTYRFRFRKLVVKRGRVGSRQDVRLDLLLFQELQSLARDFEAFLHSSG